MRSQAARSLLPIDIIDLPPIRGSEVTLEEWKRYLRTLQRQPPYWVQSDIKNIKRKIAELKKKEM